MPPAAGTKNRPPAPGRLRCCTNVNLPPGIFVPLPPRERLGEGSFFYGEVRLLGTRHGEKGFALTPLPLGEGSVRVPCVLHAALLLFCLPFDEDYASLIGPGGAKACSQRRRLAVARAQPLVKRPPRELKPCKGDI
jgi:hypothetical protein